MPTLPVHDGRHGRRSTILATVALAALLGACNVAPGATQRPPSAAPPSGQPSTPPSSPGTTPAVTPSPTPSASPSPVPSPTFRSDQIVHPTGAHDIVLRMETGGGFVPMGFFLTQAPTFTLYGDGTVIFQQVDTRVDAFNEPMLPWLVGHLDEDGIQSLLQFAMSTGRLANARASYEDPMIADAGTTIFNLNAGGLEKIVSVYALSEMQQPGPDAADRRGFSQLAEALRNFQTQEGLGEVVPYDAAWYRVVLMEAFGEPINAPEEWPWDDVGLDDFPRGDEPGGITNLDKEHVAQLLETPNGGHIGLWVESPDGETFVQLGVRPLLPDEIAAAELE